MAKKNQNVTKAADKCADDINKAIKEKSSYNNARWFLIGKTGSSLHPSIVEILTTFFGVEVDDEDGDNNVVKLKNSWDKGVEAQDNENINKDDGDKAVDALLKFVEEAKKIKIKGMFSRTAKIRDALIKAVKEYDRRLALEEVADNKISKFFDASLKVAKSFVRDLKDLISGTKAKELDNSKAKEAQKAITKMYKTLCKLAELDLNKDKKAKKGEGPRVNGLIPWYNANKGKTEVEGIGKAILNLYERKGNFFGISRIKSFLTIFDKDKLFKERIKKACGLVEQIIDAEEGQQQNENDKEDDKKDNKEDNKEENKEENKK